MNMGQIVDALGGWCYRSSLARELERRWYRSRLWGLVRDSRHRKRVSRYRPRHLYEMVISNDRMWFKLQAPCWSSRQAAEFMEARFNGTRYVTADGHRPVTPFRLSNCSSDMALLHDSTAPLLIAIENRHTRRGRHALRRRCLQDRPPVHSEGQRQLRS